MPTIIVVRLDKSLTLISMEGWFIIIFIYFVQPMLEFHQGKVDCIATMMGTEATRQQSVNFGCIVEDKNTHRKTNIL